jgi:DNA repair protein RadC
MADQLAVRQWARADRPREKLLDHGAAALSVAELLAVVLRTGTEGETVLDQARAVLEAAGNTLQGLAHVSLADLRAVKGIGPAKAGQVLAVVELCKRFGEIEFPPGEAFRSSQDIYAHFRTRLADERCEQFYAVLLDNKHRKIRDVCVSQGSLTASIVHPREVFLPVIRESAAAVIFVHNHPSGDPTPSREDIDITRRLRDVGELMGVRVLDHIVIGRGRYVSFVDDGYW